MKELACDYVLVRYVANPLRDEARNVGLVLRSTEGQYVGCRFLPDLSKHLAHDADKTDILMIGEYIADLERNFNFYSSKKGSLFSSETVFAPDYLERLWRKSEGKLQFSQPRATITADPNQELGKLFWLFIAPETKSESGAAKQPFFDQVLSELEKRSLRNRVGVKYPVKLGNHKLVFSLGYKAPQGKNRDVVMDVVDLGAGTFQQRMRTLAPTSVKFEIAKNHLLPLEAFCLVKKPQPQDKQTENLDLEMETLARHADRVFDFDIAGQREHLLKRIEGDLTA